MTRVKLADFLTRHQFQAVDVQKLQATPTLTPLAQAGLDTDGDGMVAGSSELEGLYRQLLALEPAATPSIGFDTTSPAGQAYSTLSTLLRQKTGTDAPLGARALSATPELAQVFAGGTPPVVLKRVDGQKTKGTGLVQDALNVVAAAAGIACNVNLGAAQRNRGMYGPGTESAVKAFQTAKHLPASGVVDEATARALDAALASARGTPTPTTPTTPPANTGVPARFAGDAALDDVRAGRATIGSGARGPHVMKLQQALLDMGFSMRPYPSTSGALVGGVDGAWGGQCETCVKNFQAHARATFPNVRVTGVVDAATLQAMDALAPAAGSVSSSSGQPGHGPPPFWNGAQQLRVVVVKDQHRTFLFDAQGRVAGIFPNAVGGQGNATHSGLKKVTGFLDEQGCKNLSRSLWNNDNSFGKRLVDLSWVGQTPARSGEELHGTYNYKDMGKDVSHGCMRHYNEDILILHQALKMGDMVAVVDSIDDPRLRAPSTPAV
ncbi:MAG: L,D-transpeptidase family protein [Deltaproteobacteria bacterium]|nr:L,D-transpeptidase family protein [Deltaproteobacteria bacterium]